MRQLERAMKVIEEREDKSDTVREEEDEADTVEAEDEANTLEAEEKMVIEDDSHVMMWEKDKVLVVDGKPQFLQSMSPVKTLGVMRVEWKDPLKLDLLRLFLLYAEDIWVRDEGQGRAKAKAQLRPIHSSKSITIDGKPVKLDIFDIDAMAKKLTFQGLSGQPKGQGLLNLVDAWVAEQNQEVKDISGRLEEVMEYAKKFSKTHNDV